MTLRPAPRRDPWAADHDGWARGRADTDVREHAPRPPQRGGRVRAQGKRDRGFMGLTGPPWVSFYTPSYRLYGVF